MLKKLIVGQVVTGSNPAVPNNNIKGFQVFAWKPFFMVDWLLHSNLIFWFKIRILLSSLRPLSPHPQHPLISLKYKSFLMVTALESF